MQNLEIFDKSFAVMDESLGVRAAKADIAPIQIAQTAFDWPWTDWQEELLNHLIYGNWSRLQVLAPPRHRKPLHEDTLVLMSDGTYKPLKDITVGDRIITHTGESSNVTAVHEQGDLPLLKITTFNGREILTAKDHPFLTPEGWKEAQNLRVNDVLAVVHSAQINNTCSRSLGEFKLAGYFVGDGSVGTYNYINKHGWKVLNQKSTITNAEKDIIEDVCKCADNMGWDYQFNGKSNTSATNINLKSGARDWVREVGLAGSKSSTKRVPEFVFQGNKEQISNYLAAHYAADGCVNKKGNARKDLAITLSSINRKLLSDVQKLLTRIGVRARIRRRTRMRKGEEYEWFILHITSQNDAAIFAQHVNIPGEKGRRIKEWLPQRTNFEELYIPDPIVSIENAGTGPCKCLSVDRDSSFVANEFAVHNSVIGSLYCAVRIGENPDTRVMVASHTRDYAILLMNQIENIMKLPIYKRMYGDLIPKGSDRVTWAKHERHIANRSTHIKDPTLLALSPDSGTPGYGADIIIIDDIVSQANSSSPTRRKHIIHWVYGSLLKRLEPDGQVLVIGARFYRDDLYGALKRSPGWDTREYVATREEPLWPQRWNSEALKQKELEDPVFFTAQYQQRPRSLASGTLNTEWFQYWLETPPMSNMAIFCGVDPVIKQKGSKFAYVIVGRAPDGIIYVLDSYSERHTATDQPRLLDAIYDEWQPHAIAWESNGPQEAVMDLSLQLVKNPLNMIKVPSIVDKYLRLSSVAGHLRQGKLLIPGSMDNDGNMEPDPTITKLYKAWGEFPGGDDDILDAFEKAVKLATQGPPPALGTSREADQNQLRQPRRGQNRLAGGGILKPSFGRVFRETNDYVTLPPDQ